MLYSQDSLCICIPIDATEPNPEKFGGCLSSKIYRQLTRLHHRGHARTANIGCRMTTWRTTRRRCTSTRRERHADRSCATLPVRRVTYMQGVYPRGWGLVDPR